MKSKSNDGNTTKRRSPPTMSIEGRENQMIALAVDLAEQQLRDGTASSQVITHYLKLGSTKEKLERERLERENELLRAKTESLQATQRTEELLENAMRVFGIYRGDRDEPDSNENKY